MITMKEFYPEEIKARNDGKIYYTAENIATAVKTGEILRGVVNLCDTSHNLMVDLGSMKGIIAKEDALASSDGSVRDIAIISRVGKTVCFTVEDVIYDLSGIPVARLSRKKAQEKFISEFLSSKSVGDVLMAKVTHLDSFGVFCDIGCGVIALLPIDFISVSRISHPKDRFFVGEDIKVILKGIGEDGRITVSHKELLGTWEENAADFTAGQTVTGVVRSVEEYGVFVELSPNLAGLAEPYETRVGDTVSVYIKSIIPDKMKVKLIIIDSFKGGFVPKTKYFYKENHIDLFSYSPPNSSKKIYTEFY
jgi:small subunit ribosomal protein S1